MNNCSIERCDLPKSSLDMCHIHYKRYKRGDRGDRLTRPIRKSCGATCSVESCRVVQLAKGLCKRHYECNRKYGDPLFTDIAKKNKPKSCRVLGCSNEWKLNPSTGTRYLINGYCRIHSEREYRERTKESYLQSSEYSTWVTMRQRCSNPNYYQWERYGGRGISVCSRWDGKGGFNNFIKDMGNKPTPKHSIDRIDPDGNYEPKNCRWATAKQQAINKTVSNKSSGGFRGVFLTQYGSYKVTVGDDYQKIYIGTYKTLEEAISARLMAESIYWS